MTSVTSALGPPRVVNIADLRRLAQRRLPRSIFDYLEGGADDESTLRENPRAFSDILFRPRNAVAFAECDLRATVVGHNLAFPAILAPVGYSRMMHPEGELAAARAAGDAGTVYALSTISGHKLENVKAATKGSAWYQLYLLGGRAAAEAGIDRARRAGYSALVFTIDTPVAGMRERDPRNGMKQMLGSSPFAKLPFLPNILAHPRWLAAFLADGGMPKLENIVIPGQGPMQLIDVSAALAEAAVCWDDLKWIRNVWSGPIIVKGILTGDDAHRAVDEGAAAVIVSNHGGRQLDSVYPTIRALPEVVAAVNGRTEVLMDGGIRRGGDIVKAICLGARAVLIGRAYAYGMAAAGYPGALRALEILRADVDRTLRLLGCPSISALDASYIDVPAHWRR
ncbi:MAG TPA: alpha-hydroxy acid oxidase [Candidatus Sulfotelmatobacter sp.]|jgi:isopentenyl diphosphate isomerase/L-lactate dehydrogenase-like FMN-dependent dehydrogenase|nr:alpha-hydroxy acid oxidase [Candidatus Sulfotelmatobacter sp.]